MNVTYRMAIEDDLPKLVSLLADDALGATREDTSTPLNSSYIEAFRKIDKDPYNELTVVERSSKLIGMMQLTFIPYLTHTGSTRCLIEGVRIHASERGKGLGTHMIEWAIERSREKGCSLVQLTTDKQRPDAIRFYESLGFKSTHEGMKLQLRSNHSSVVTE